MPHGVTWAGLRMDYLQFFPWKLFSSQPALPVLTLCEQLSLLFLHSSILPSPSRLHKAIVRACQSQTQAHGAPLSTRFPRQEYWSGFPFPSDPAIESTSAICRGFDRKRAPYKWRSFIALPGTLLNLRSPELDLEGELGQKGAHGAKCNLEIKALSCNLHLLHCKGGSSPLSHQGITTPLAEWVKVTQWCPTLCDPTDYSSPDSSVHGILQVKIFGEWVAISFSRGSFWPRYWTRVSHTAGRFFTTLATREYHSAERIWSYKNRPEYSGAVNYVTSSAITFSQQNPNISKLHLEPWAPFCPSPPSDCLWKR